MVALITGNIVTDLLLYGGLGGLLIGLLVWGGPFKTLYWNLIARFFPVTSFIKRPTQEGPIIFRDYGQKVKKNGKLYLKFFRTKTQTDPIEHSDLIRLEGPQGATEIFYGTQISPTKVIPRVMKDGLLKTIKNEILDAEGKPTGAFSEEKIIEEITIMEPQYRSEADLFLRESTDDYIKTERYKKKAPPWWANPVFAVYLGTGIMLFCLFLGISIAYPKVLESTQGFLRGAVEAGIRAGIEAGIKTYFGLKAGSLNVTFNDSYANNVPPELVNSLFGKIAGSGG